MNRSLGIFAVGAVCLGALGAAITLPALVLGGSETPPSGLPLAGGGTRTVVHAEALPAPKPAARSHETGFAPAFVPSLVPAAGRLPLPAPGTGSVAPNTPVRLSPPADRGKPAREDNTPPPAEQPQVVSTPLEQTDAKKSEHEAKKRAKRAEHEQKEQAKKSKGHSDHGESGHEDHPKGRGEQAKHDNGPKPEHDHGSKPEHGHDQKPKHDPGPTAEKEHGPKSNENHGHGDQGHGDQGHEDHGHGESKR